MIELLILNIIVPVCGVLWIARRQSTAAEANVRSLQTILDHQLVMDMDKKLKERS